MARGETQTSLAGINPAHGRQRRSLPSSRRLAYAVAVSALGGFSLVVALVWRAVAVAALGGLLVALSLVAALAVPRSRRYVGRNLPAGGPLILATLLALLVGGLLEAAEVAENRSILLVLLGAAGLLIGALSDGLRHAKFRTSIESRGLSDPTPQRWSDRSWRTLRELNRAAVVVAAGILGLIVFFVFWGEVASPQESTIAVLAGLFLAVGAAAGGARLVTVVLAGKGSARSRRQLAAAVATLGPEVLVHFSGGIAARYQLAHWMPALAATGLPWILIYREAPTYEAGADTDPAPAVLIEDFGDLDLVVGESVQTVLFVNTATKNNHIVRFDEPIHIQLHHGDSDKPPSSGKTMRLYDAHFVAGRAARERLESVGVATDRIFEVGRPITDSLSLVADTTDGPSTILYAPTWEGAHADSNLSSLASLGEGIVRAMAATGREFVFRPHPLSGTADAAASAARRRITDLVRSLGGVVDDGTDDLITALGRAGLLICDVSSVLVDWYAADRPALVTDVAGVGAEELRQRYPTTTGAGVIAPNLPGLEALIEESLHSDPWRRARAEAAAATLGGVGSAQARFESALAAVSRPR